jgi:hypothetical protein
MDDELELDDEELTEDELDEILLLLTLDEDELTDEELEL